MSEAVEAAIDLVPEESTALLRRREDPVGAWLDSIDERRRSTVLQYAVAERSPVISYLYASLLGFSGSVDQWEAYCYRHFDRLDTRGLLQAEVIKLQDDLDAIRQLVSDGRMRAGDAPTKISYLAREMRGHIELLSKEQSIHDRRSLLLAGVEICSKMLRKVFGRDGSTWPAIEATLEACFAEVEERHKLK